MSLSMEQLWESVQTDRSRTGAKPPVTKGLRRREFILWSLLFWFVTVILANSGHREPAVAWAVYGLVAVGFVIVNVKRFQNIGFNGALALLSLVPFANLAVLAFCVCFPENFRQTERMDLSGWVLLVSFLPFLMALFMTAAFFPK